MRPFYVVLLLKCYLPEDKKVCQGVDMEVRQSSRLKGVKRFTPVPFYLLFFKYFILDIVCIKATGEFNCHLGWLMCCCDDFAAPRSLIARFCVYAFDLRSTSLPTFFTLIFPLI
jgi:hypothetical protein